jgi:hypothetical protein
VVDLCGLGGVFSRVMSDTGGQFENPYASPQSEEAAVVSNPTPAWRDGKLVVVAPDGELPRRCAKCGGDASGKLRKAYLRPIKPAKPAPRWLVILTILGFMIGAPIIVTIITSAKFQPPEWPPWLLKSPVKPHHVLLIVVFLLAGLPSVRNIFRNDEQCLRYTTSCR